jgi:hypothetical protein
LIYFILLDYKFNNSLNKAELLYESYGVMNNCYEIMVINKFNGIDLKLNLLIKVDM